MGSINGQFRYKEKIPLPYDVQGYIFFYCKRYKKLTAHEQHMINKICHDVSGQYHTAVLKFVTTNQGAETICRKYYIGLSTLEKYVKAFYIELAEAIL